MEGQGAEKRMFATVLISIFQFSYDHLFSVLFFTAFFADTPVSCTGSCHKTVL